MASAFKQLARKSPIGGLNRQSDDRTRLAETDWWTAHNAQFRRGLLTKVGGWTKLAATVDGRVSMIQPIRLAVGEVSVIATSHHLYTVNADLSVTPFQDCDALSTDYWRADYLNGNAYFNNNSGGLLKWSGSGACAVIPTSNFVGRELVQFANNLLMGRLNAATSDGPLSFVGSGLNNTADWATDDPASDASLEDIPNGGDAIQRIVRLGETAAVYKERSIHLLSYRGLPDVYSIRQRVGDEGLVSQHAIVSIGNSHVFQGQQNLYSFVGSDPQPIGDKVWKYYTSLIFENKRDITYAFHHQKQKEVWFVFATLDGDPNRALVWNYEVNAFSTRDCPFIALGYVRSPAVTASSTSPTIDQVDAIMSETDPKADVIYKNEGDTTINLEDYRLIGAKGDGTLWELEPAGDDGRAGPDNISMCLESGTTDLGGTLNRMAQGGFRFDIPLMTGQPCKVWASARRSLSTPVAYKGPYLLKPGQDLLKFFVAGRFFDWKIVKDNGQMALRNYAPLVKELT